MMIMRRARGLALATAVALGGAVGGALCGGAGVLLGLASAGHAAEGSDTLSIVYPSLWNEALDPILANSGSSSGLSALYDDLIGARSDGSGLSKETGVAEDWSMSPDGRVWTLKIRKGIQFHRGFGELTAEDVAFSLRRLASERAVTQYKTFFKDAVDKIEVVDRYTVRVTGKDPIPTFPTLVSALQGSPERFVVSKAAVEKLGEDGFSREPVGSGPYAFVSRIGGQSISLDAVPDHWRVGTPVHAHLRLLAVPEEETSIAMLQRGDVDIIPLARSNVARVRDDGFKVVLQQNASAINVFLEGQEVETVPVAKEKVREALNLAVDRKALVDGLFNGLGQPVGTYYVQTPILDQLGYDWKADLYPYDPKKARALLAEAGHPDGFDIDFYMYPWTGLPESSTVLQAVAGMWSDIGVRVKLIPTDYAVVRAKMLKGEMPGAAGYFPAPARPWQGALQAYQAFMYSRGAFHHVKIPELDAILDAASNATDPEVGKARLAEAMRYVRAHHLAVPILEYDVAYGVSPAVRDWNPGYLPFNLNLDSLFRR